MINNNISFTGLHTSLLSTEKSHLSALKKLVFWIPFVKASAYSKCAKTCISLIQASEKDGMTYADKEGLDKTIKGLSDLSQKIQKSHFANKKIRMRLDRQIMALSARAGIRPEGGEKLVSKDSMDVFKEACKKYKAHTYSIKETEKDLNQNDDFSISTLATQYPRFLELLNENKQLRHQFFEWTVLHKLPVDMFVKYSTINERIPDAALRHIAMGCPNALKESTDGKLTLKCMVSDSNLPGHLTPKYFNVLDPHAKVAFTAEKVPTMKEILTQFPMASSANRDYQVFEDGLHLWNTGGYTGAAAPEGIDRSKANWWNDLPAYKTLNLKDAQKRYGDVLDGKNWVMSPRSVHSSSDLDLGGNHSYLEVVIPNEDGSGYRIYPFGRDPHRDPQGGLETLKFLTKTTFGRVIYADQGAYYSERRNTGISIALNPEKGQELMNNIRDDIEKGLSGSLSFQLSGNNCAKWVQEKVDQITGDDNSQKTERTIPPLFSVHAKKIKGPVFKGPKFLTQGLLTVLGAHRKEKIGDENIKLANTRIYKEKVIYHPTYMFQQLVNPEMDLKASYNLA
jgi:hypothetical protein